MSDPWIGKTVFVTGVCGTVGSEVLRQLLATGVSRVVGVDNNESSVFSAENTYAADSRVKIYLGDVRDADALRQQSEGADVILHCAAFKHVIVCEESPRQAVRTNIEGTQNIIDAAVANGVERVIFTSSDKAVNPTNVMGTSKLMGERLMTAANATRREGGPIFSCTRFGNVLGSRGSVIPVFLDQISSGGPVTLTDPGMTRFVMSIEEAARLVLDTVFLARGGEVFVTKMPVMRIADLAEVLIEQLSGSGAIPVDVIGAKAGEKLYEELMSDEEVRRAVELDRFFVIKPAFTSVYGDVEYDYGQDAAPASRQYNSSIESPVSADELLGLLRSWQILEQG